MEKKQVSFNDDIEIQEFTKSRKIQPQKKNRKRKTEKKSKLEKKETKKIKKQEDDSTKKPIGEPPFPTGPLPTIIIPAKYPYNINKTEDIFDLPKLDDVNPLELKPLEPFDVSSPILSPISSPSPVPPPVPSCPPPDWKPAKKWWTDNASDYFKGTVRKVDNNERVTEEITTEEEKDIMSHFHLPTAKIGKSVKKNSLRDRLMKDPLYKLNQLKVLTENTTLYKKISKENEKEKHLTLFEHIANLNEINKKKNTKMTLFEYITTLNKVDKETAKESRRVRTEILKLKKTNFGIQKKVYVSRQIIANNRPRVKGRFVSSSIKIVS